MGDVTKGKLLTMREAAALTGVPHWTMKRRLLHLHNVHGGVLESFARPGTAVRKYHIRRDRLLAIWGSDVNEVGQADNDSPEGEIEHRVDALGHRIEDLETKLAALRNAHRATRAELRTVAARLARLEGRQPSDVGRDAA